MAGFSYQLLLLAASLLLQAVLTLAGENGNCKATFYTSSYDVGACGMGNVRDYPIQTTYIAALSRALFKGGLGCAQCFRLTSTCTNGQVKTVEVKSTDMCPDSGWCDKPHFDLSYDAFGALACGEYQRGVLDIKYEQVDCRPNGMISLMVRDSAHPYWLSVRFENMAGMGNIDKVWLRDGTNGPWIDFPRDWGMFFSKSTPPMGAISFRIANGMGQEVIANNCLPAGWRAGGRYTCNVQFPMMGGGQNNGGGGGGAPKPRPKPAPRPKPRPPKKGKKPKKPRGMRKGGMHGPGKGMHRPGKGMRRGMRA